MFPKGKFVRINPENPDAVARCDRSGQLCNHADLVKQMDYRGNGFLWTVLWVNKCFADVPNPQSLNPVLKPDPVPVDHPRPWETAQDYWSNQYGNWDVQAQPIWAAWGDWRNVI